MSPYRYRNADHRGADADSRADVGADHRSADVGADDRSADVDADHRGTDHRQDGRCGAVWVHREYP